LNTKEITSSKGSWPSFFGLKIYHLWIDRNKLAFSNQTTLASGLMQHVLAEVKFIKTNLDKQTFS